MVPNGPKWSKKIYSIGWPLNPGLLGLVYKGTAVQNWFSVVVFKEYRIGINSESAIYNCVQPGLRIIYIIDLTYIASTSYQGNKYLKGTHIVTKGCCALKV